MSERVYGRYGVHALVKGSVGGWSAVSLSEEFARPALQPTPDHADKQESCSAFVMICLAFCVYNRCVQTVGHPRLLLHHPLAPIQDRQM